MMGCLIMVNSELETYYNRIMKIIDKEILSLRNDIEYAELEHDTCAITRYDYDIDTLKVVKNKIKKDWEQNFDNKRFIISDNGIKDNGKHLTWEELCNVLNSLNDENIMLKK